MSLARVVRVLRKDLAMGPRSPFFLYALVLPVVMTLLIQLAFGSLFEPRPRMGIVDAGDSEITAAVAAIEGIELTRLDDAEDLKRRVEGNDLDAGLVLPADFDRAVRAGEKPPLEMYVGGESLASTRIVLNVTTLDLVRHVEGSAPPADVRLVNLGDAPALPVATRLVPLILFYALIMAGVFVPASSLVEEKEAGTLTALLVTPASASEVVTAKAMLGVILAFAMSLVTLVLNDALGTRPFALITVVLVASVYSALLGLVLGTGSKNSTTLFSLIKGAGFFLIGPVVFYLFPDWPQWIAKIFPTYWMINPIWEVGIQGRGLGDVWVDIAVAGGICLVMIPLIARLSRRMVGLAAGG